MSNCKNYSEKTHEAKLCAKCGNPFGCGVGGKCWCMEISLSDEALKVLEDQYQGCLCPDCLNSFTNL